MERWQFTLPQGVKYPCPCKSNAAESLLKKHQTSQSHLQIAAVSLGQVPDESGNVPPCTRGHIVGLARKELEGFACECHAVVKTEYDRRLPDQMAIQWLLVRMTQPTVQWKYQVLCALGDSHTDGIVADWVWSQGQ